MPQNSRPRGGSEYSRRGGVSEYTVRVMSRAFSRSLRRVATVDELTSPNRLRNSVNRMVPRLAMRLSSPSAYRRPMILASGVAGHRQSLSESAAPHPQVG